MTLVPTNEVLMSEKELWILWGNIFKGPRPKNLSNDAAANAVIMSLGLQRVKEKLNELRLTE
jgi:hypothetical protein